MVPASWRCRVTRRYELLLILAGFIWSVALLAGAVAGVHQWANTYDPFWDDPETGYLHTHPA